MKHVIAAVSKAKQDMAAHMTVHLRESALNHGWSPEVVSSMEVHHGKDGYQVTVPDEHKDQFMTHEYGSETVRPTAVVRKFFNDTNASQSFFVKRMNEHLGGKV
jgi:hypothetical protein